MIDAKIIDVQPHPDQATNNPNTWAVQLRVSHAGRSRTFWRWYNAREKTMPSSDDIIARFWDDTFADLHGFCFEKEHEA